MPTKNRFMNRGAAILSICFALFFFAIFSRFAYIQATGKVEGEVLAARAHEQYEKGRPIFAQRGTILDRNGEAIAKDAPSYTIIAILDKELTTDKKHPKHVQDKAKTAKELSPILEMDEGEILDILNKNKKQVEFGKAGRDISLEKKEEIEKLELPGIAFNRESKRYYPNGTFASSLIGYSTYNDKLKQMTGVMGLEQSLNNYLVKKDGFVSYESDLGGWKLPNSKDKIISPENGKDIHLTLDKKIQSVLEDSMSEAAKKYEPKKIMVAVMNPKTGEILAMGQRPSFDPNKRDITNYYNDIVSYPFEPGSTMKIFTLAAAVEEGVYNGEDKFHSGTYNVGKSKIGDHNAGKGWGEITFQEGVERSSNVGFAILANEKLGANRFNQYLHKFHFYEKTGVDIPDEAKSTINFKYDIEKVTASFGQGSAITAIQQLQAASAIANNGKMMKPYVIDHITDPNDNNKTVLQNSPKSAGQPISANTAKQVRDILEKVITSKNGTGKPYKIDGFDIAGKTGTAQMAGADGKLLTGRENYIFSFLGMAPKDDPQLIVYVAVQQPKLKDTESGSAPVSAIFKPVMENGLHYLNIKPKEKTAEGNENSKEQSDTLSDFAGMRMETAEKRVKDEGYTPVRIGEGVAVHEQYPGPGTGMLVNEKVFLISDGSIKMPDMTGWSRRDVLNFSNLSGIHFELNGQGFATKQSAKAGKDINEKTTVKVEFKK